MHQNQESTVLQQPELRHLKVLYGIYVFLIVTLLVMPQYFGIHIGYDITCSRFANIFFIVYIMSVPFVLTHFWKTIIRCAPFYPLMLYLFVSAYTMIFRVDINACFLIFLELLTFFMLIYGIRYVLGVKKALKLCTGCAYFLAIEGFVEYLYGKSIFLQFLATVPTNVGNGYRSGHFRIMGPCGHSLAYGLLLLIFIAVISYDYEKDELYLFRKPVLLIMLLANSFLTGSRSSLGIAIFECLLIVLFTKGVNLKKTLIILGIGSVVFVGLLIMLQDTSIGRYFMGQIMSVIDQVFGTSYAAKYGIDTETLENSAKYREALPYIFQLDWLNPVIGRGRRFSGAYVHGTYVHSVDNYYVVQYIKYAYPGLISYILFLIVTLCILIHEICCYKSGMAKMVLIGAGCYFFNLWWVDSLQTLKFVYLLLAIFFAYQLERKDKTACKSNLWSYKIKETLKKRQQQQRITENES